MKNDNNQKQINKIILNSLGSLGKTFFVLWFLYYHLVFFILWSLVDSEVNSRGGLDGKVKRLIGFVNREQQTHYLERRKFTISLKELGLSDGVYSSVLQYYQISINTTPNEVYTYLSPYSEKISTSFLPPIEIIIKKDLKAYVSLMAVDRENQLSEVVCASTTPGLTQPEPPLIKDDRLIFAPGTVEVDRTPSYQ